MRGIVLPPIDAQTQFVSGNYGDDAVDNYDQPNYGVDIQEEY